ncbi:hypothetical protein BDF14DRAFT_1757933 [Spinellus fusiger]|nr:hypothetical protein BDF14DRAFT_1757933 [Spinellus fusiger]
MSQHRQLSARALLIEESNKLKKELGIQCRLEFVTHLRGENAFTATVTVLNQSFTCKQVQQTARKAREAAAEEALIKLGLLNRRQGKIEQKKIPGISPNITTPSPLISANNNSHAVHSNHFNSNHFNSNHFNSNHFNSNHGMHNNHVSDNSRHVSDSNHTNSPHNHSSHNKHVNNNDHERLSLHKSINSKQDHINSQNINNYTSNINTTITKGTSSSQRAMNVHGTNTSQSPHIMTSTSMASTSTDSATMASTSIASTPMKIEHLNTTTGFQISENKAVIKAQAWLTRVLRLQNDPNEKKRSYVDILEAFAAAMPCMQPRFEVSEDTSPQLKYLSPCYTCTVFMDNFTVTTEESMPTPIVAREQCASLALLLLADTLCPTDVYDALVQNISTVAGFKRVSLTHDNRIVLNANSRSELMVLFEALIKLEWSIGEMTYVERNHNYVCSIDIDREPETPIRSTVKTWSHDKATARNAAAKYILDWMVSENYILIAH